MTGNWRRAIVTGTLLGIGVIAIAGIALTVFREGLSVQAAKRSERTLIVLSADDEQGVEVAQLVYVLDLSAARPSVSAVDPTRRAVVPGTSYASLRDAYPFGGGGAVSRAFARLEGERPLPYVSVPWEMWSSWVTQGRGVRAYVPENSTAYVGGRLFGFRRGVSTLSAPELQALLCAMDYVKSPSARYAAREKLARAVLDEIAYSRRGAMGTALSSEGVKTSLGAQGLKRVGEGLGSSELRWMPIDAPGR